MSVTGRVNVDAVIYDTDGTSAINVVKLAESVAVGGASQLVAITEGTAADADQITFNVNSHFNYRDASGAIPQFSQIDYLLFRWSGEYPRTLSSEQCILFSFKNLLAFSASDGSNVTLSTGTGTGTYTIIAIGQS